MVITAKSDAAPAAMFCLENKTHGHLILGNPDLQRTVSTDTHQFRPAYDWRPGQFMPVMTETPTSLRIQKARTSLILDHPFFGSLLFRLKGRECRTIPTMATDGVSLFYNPDFVETLNSATLAGTLAHEVMRTHSRYSN